MGDMPPAHTRFPIKSDSWIVRDRNKPIRYVNLEADGEKKAKDFWLKSEKEAYKLDNDPYGEKD